MNPSSPQSDAAAEVKRLIVRKEDIEAEMVSSEHSCSLPETGTR